MMSRWLKVLLLITAVAVAAGGVASVAAKRSEARGAQHHRPADPDPAAPATPSTDPAPTPSPETPSEEPIETPSLDPVPVSGKSIEVSLEKQELTAWENGVVAYRFRVSTGRRGYDTPAGRFKVHTKYLNRWSRKWKVWMPYAIFWHPKHGYAFHELPYKPGSTHRIGKSRLGRADSHGCVRVNVGDAKLLYEWTPVGTPVWVH